MPYQSCNQSEKIVVVLSPSKRNRTDEDEKDVDYVPKKKSVDTSNTRGNGQNATRASDQKWKVEESDGQERFQDSEIYCMKSPLSSPTVVNAQGHTIEQVAAKVVVPINDPVVVVIEIFTPSKVVDPSYIVEKDSGVTDTEHIMLEETCRVKLPGTLYKSLFVSEFDSGMNTIPTGTQSGILDRKHPFESDVDLSLDLGVHMLNDKGWFSKLYTIGEALSSTHLDVIFYYLRKKGKYGPNVNVKFTTTNFLFHYKLIDQHSNFAQNKKDKSVLPMEHILAEYMLGYVVDANVPWHTIDHVLLPIHIKSRWPWVLGVFTIKDRCIYVYDSKRATMNDRHVPDVVESYAELIPIYLEMTHFHEKRKDIDWLSDAYLGKNLAEPLDIKLVDGLSQQKSADCGAFVAAFAEYFIMEKSFPKPTNAFDIQMIRSRNATLLWEYAMAKKELSGAVSDSEITGRIYGVRRNKKDDGKAKKRKKK